MFDAGALSEPYPGLVFFVVGEAPRFLRGPMILGHEKVENGSAELFEPGINFLLRLNPKLAIKQDTPLIRFIEMLLLPLAAALARAPQIAKAGLRSLERQVWGFGGAGACRVWTLSAVPHLSCSTLPPSPETRACLGSFNVPSRHKLYMYRRISIQTYIPPYTHAYIHTCTSYTIADMCVSFCSSLLVAVLTVCRSVCSITNVHMGKAS